MIQKLLEAGIKPLRPKMRKTRTIDGEYEYIFRGFTRVLKLEYSEVWIYEE
jgi:hypothetical protein